MAATTVPSSSRTLPTELTSFVGRRDELASIRRLLGSTRLLSLTGPGGVGKTRLAVRTAHDVARHYADGVCFVELAEVQDPAMVTAAVFVALGLQDRAAGWSVPVLAEYLATKRLLLVLDNCEHVLDPVAVLAGTLLRACPNLAILATSRQALGVTGEVVNPVTPMAVPNADDVSPDVTQSDGIRLFLERAAALQPAFSIDETNLGRVLEVCRRLDGVPLALELAAVRLNALGLDALLAGVSGSEGSLGTGDRSRAPRQQTLEATIDWSYRLLSEAERSLWARLSVFAGGFELDAAEVVCGDAALAGRQIPALVATLVEKSLVQREMVSGRERFRILEILRQFGRERLRDLQDERLLQIRHGEWIERLSERVAADDQGMVEAIGRMRVERANLWAALDFCQGEPDQVERGITICVNLHAYWLTEGQVSEVVANLSALLDHVASAGILRAQALSELGFLCASKADHASARRYSEEALEIGHALGSADLVAWALTALASADWAEGRLDQAVARASEAVGLARTMGLGFQHLTALNVLGLAQVFGGNAEAAVGTGREAIVVSDRLGETWLRGYSIHFFSLALLRSRQVDDAEHLARQGIVLRRNLGHVSGSLAEVLAGVEMARGHEGRATTLLGGADAIWRSVSWTQYRPVLPDYENLRAEARSRLGDTRFEAAYDVGLSMSRDEVSDYALGLDPPAGRARPEPVKGPAGLSSREMEVARLIADGVSNAQTAAQLFISERTVESHVTNILNKLGMDSRVQVARWIAGLEARSEA